MRFLRLLIIGLPLLLIGLLAASFFSVRVSPPKEENMMVTASIGEPKMLNPIQAADASASEVMNYVFDGLLTLDENLEVTGRLAESWMLTQTTTAFYVNEKAAADALGRIEASRELWSGWKLLRAEVTGAELRLFFSEPGADIGKDVLALAPDSPPEKIFHTRVNLKSSARESWVHFLEQSRMKDRVKRIWYDYNSAFELTYIDPDGEFGQELKNYYSANRDLEPELAEQDAAEYLDEPELVFKLRRDVQWHDGAPFTSKDVLFTYNKIMDETIVSPRKPDYDLVQTIETPTPYDVRVIYRKPYSPALNSWMIGLLPQHILGDKDSQWWAANFNRSPVGTGSFKFKLWSTNERIELTRNPDYFRGAPHLGGITFRVIPDPTSIRIAFETHQSDSWGVEPHAVGKFAHDPRFDVFSSPGSMYSYIGWNLRRPMFQDLRVRQALAHAVDVQAIIKYVLYGYGQPSTGMWDPRMWWNDDTIKPLAYDPEKAKALLAAAGWKPGPDGILQKDGKPFEFTLITNNANDVRRDIATLTQAALSKIGIRVDVQVYEWAVFLAQFIDKGEFDACVLGWTTGVDYDQYQIWHSSQTGPSQLNFVAYKNPEVDRMLVEIRSEFDHQKIKELAGKLQRTIFADQPYLFLFVPETTSVIWKNSYRVYRPETGGWVDEPIRQTRAGYSFYSEYFYKPAYAPAMTH